MREERNKISEINKNKRLKLINYLFIINRMFFFFSAYYLQLTNNGEKKQLKIY